MNKYCVIRPSGIVHDPFMIDKALLRIYNDPRLFEAIKKLDKEMEDKNDRKK